MYPILHKLNYMYKEKNKYFKYTTSKIYNDIFINLLCCTNFISRRQKKIMSYRCTCINHHEGKKK